MGARRAWWLAALATCACAAAAAPHDVDASPAPVCDTLLLENKPAPPQRILNHESVVVNTARALSELIGSGAADSARASSLARAASQASLTPPLAAVALGAPHLHLGVLYIVEADRLILFHQNNSQELQQFWRTLASSWNVSAVLWSAGWFGCGPEGLGWWSGVAAARGEKTARAAAALFYRHESLPCEEAMNDWLGGAPPCDPDTTLCEAFPSSSIGSINRLEHRCLCRAGHWLAAGEGGAAWCARCSRAAGAACLGLTARAVLLSANLAGALLCLIVAFIIFKKRKSKVVAMGMWTVLEVVVLGAFLMYASAGSAFLSDERARCVVGAWLRELGFVSCYGSVVLRLWVLLAEFRTRKAHRWTPRDAEVLKIVGAMVVGAACYLAAFTSTSVCAAAGSEGGGEESCAHSRWHHVTAAGEILLLLVGLRIAYAARNANVPFQERGWLAGALAGEALCGAAWRGAAALGHAPERDALLAAARAHLSAGAALACVLAPRLWHARRSAHSLEQTSRRELCGGGNGGAGTLGAGGEDEPSAEEARAELRRLYAQLEVLRGRALRRDNPHVSRRRGGRKPPHRRFSLQALQARRGGKNKGGSNMETSDVGESRTPEDSVCSIEGPSHYTDGDVQ